MNRLQFIEVRHEDKKNDNNPKGIHIYLPSIFKLTVFCGTTLSKLISKFKFPYPCSNNKHGSTNFVCEYPDVNIVGETITKYGGLVPAKLRAHTSLTTVGVAPKETPLISTCAPDGKLVMLKGTIVRVVQPIQILISKIETILSISNPIPLAIIISLYLLLAGSQAQAASGTGVSPSPGGPDTAIQFGKSHVFTGTSTLTMNPTTNLLTVGSNALFTAVSTTQWTNVSTMTFGAGTILRLEYVSPNSCLETDSFGNVQSSTNGLCGSGTGGGGGGSILDTTNTFSGGNTFLYGVTAASFTAAGSGVGVLTLKDTAADHFVSLEASGTLTSDISLVLPSSTGTIGYGITINGVDGNGKISTIWAPSSGIDATAAHLPSTQTFSGINTFTNTTILSGISTTTFAAVSTVTFNNVLISIPAGSTIADDGPIIANGSAGTAGQVLNSNGPGASVSWGTGGGGGGSGGYALQPATVTPNLALGVLVSTLVVTSSASFSGSASTITFNVGSTNFNSVSSMTFTNSALVLVAGSTLSIGGSIVANGAYGTAGQVLSSNGPNTSVSWTTVTGGTGSGGVNSGTLGQMAYYAVAGTTVSGTSNLINNTSSVTVAVPAFFISSTTVQQSLSVGTTTVSQNQEVLIVTPSNRVGLVIQDPSVGDGGTGTGSVDLVEFKDDNGIVIASVTTSGSFVSQSSVTANLDIESPLYRFTNSNNATLTSVGGNVLVTASGHTNTRFVGTSSSNIDNVVFGRTSAAYQPQGDFNMDGFAVNTTPSVALQSAEPWAAYSASVNGDGNGLAQLYFGARSKIGEDTFFAIAPGTNTSCGVACFTNNPVTTTPLFVVDTNLASSRLGNVGIGVSTPTVALDVLGSGNFTGTVTATLAPTSKTIAQLHALTPSSAGLVYYCSDCTTDGIVVSTGTAISAFGRVSARTTAPQ